MKSISDEVEDGLVRHLASCAFQLGKCAACCRGLFEYGFCLKVDVKRKGRYLVNHGIREMIWALRYHPNLASTSSREVMVSGSVTASSAWVQPRPLTHNVGHPSERAGKMSLA